MSDFIRARQRVLTALSPHQANRNVIVPNRRPLFRPKPEPGDELRFIWTPENGASQANHDGYATDPPFEGFAAGGLEPGEWFNLHIARLIVNLTNVDRAILNFGEVSPPRSMIPNVEVIELDLTEAGGFVPAIQPMFWSRAENRYQNARNAEGTGLSDWLQLLLGTDVPITLRVQQLTDEVAEIDWAGLAEPDEGIHVRFHSRRDAGQVAEYLNPLNWRVVYSYEQNPDNPGAPGFVPIEGVSQTDAFAFFIDLENGNVGTGGLGRVTYTPPSAATQFFDRLTFTGAPG